MRDEVQTVRVYEQCFFVFFQKFRNQCDAFFPFSQSGTCADRIVGCEVQIRKVTFNTGRFRNTDLYDWK